MLVLDTLSDRYFLLAKAEVNLIHLCSSKSSFYLPCQPGQLLKLTGKNILLREAGRVERLIIEILSGQKKMIPGDSKGYSNGSSFML